MHDFASYESSDHYARIEAAVVDEPEWKARGMYDDMIEDAIDHIDERRYALIGQY